MVDKSRRNFLKSSARAGAGLGIAYVTGACAKVAETIEEIAQANSEYTQIGKYKVENSAVQYVEKIAQATEGSLEDACEKVLMFDWRMRQSHSYGYRGLEGSGETNYRLWSLYPTIDSFSPEGFKKAFPKGTTITEFFAEVVLVHMDTKTFRGDFSKKDLESSLKEYERSKHSNYGQEPEFPYGKPVE